MEFPCTALDVSMKDWSKKGTQVQVCVALPPEYVERVKRLAEETHEPVAHYFREALRLLFEKYAKTLRKAK